MRIFTFPMLLSILLLSATAQPQTPTTKIADVVKEFYSNYNLDTMTDRLISFEKRAGQWMVGIKKMENDKFVTDKRFLFYNDKKRAFEALPLKRHDAPLPVIAEQYMEAYESFNFDLQLYYGYDGWYNDVINVLKDKPDLTDDQLYGLGRAYETFATGLLTNKADFISPGHALPLPFSHNSMNTAQISQYSGAQQKAVDIFQKLALRSPDYATMVGNVRIKLANEIMTRFHLLLTYASDYAMRMSIPPVTYPDSLLQKTRATLKACPPDAIFLSFGDNDFYPVLYLQKVEKLRPDIYLINYNLIASERFLYRTVFPQFAARPISLTIDSSVYRNPKNIYLYVDERSGSITVDQLMKMLESPDNRENYGVVTVEAEVLVLNKSQANPALGQATLPLNGIRHLIMNHWALLDIMNNIGKRSLCMMNEFFDELQGLNKFLEEKDGIFIYPRSN